MYCCRGWKKGHDNDIRDGMCDFDKLVDIIGNYKDKEGNPVVIESKF